MQNVVKHTTQTPHYLIMPSSTSKRWRRFKNIFIVKMGCGCGPKTTDIVEPRPNYKTSPDTKSPSSSVSPENHCRSNWSGTVSPCPKIRDSFAIEKDSEDPYQDFHQSMLQMILEKEIYSRDDLQQLLRCFLELNSPHHHGVIVRAFMEIWNGGVLGGGMEAERAPHPCSSAKVT